LLAEHKDLSNEKFSLVEIAADPNIVDRTIRKYLRSILYHNLAKVDYLYKCALGFPIIDKIADKSTLFRAIQYRHDCVHRNGFDADGDELKIFTRELIRDTSDLVRGFVETIEAQIQSKSASLEPE
jgi:hypothetical protein